MICNNSLFLLLKKWILLTFWAGGGMCSIRIIRSYDARLYLRNSGFSKSGSKWYLEYLPRVEILFLYFVLSPNVYRFRNQYFLEWNYIFLRGQKTIPQIGKYEEDGRRKRWMRKKSSEVHPYKKISSRVFFVNKS